jgi:fructose-1,6-bisphosphatase/inositol monophosphatase family enzyme
MTTLDHAVEEECRRILLEEEEGEGVRGEEEGYISCFHVCC